MSANFDQERSSELFFFFLSFLCGAVAFFDPVRWGGALSQMRSRMSSRPYESAIATIGLFLLFVVNRRLKIGLKI